MKQIKFLQTKRKYYCYNPSKSSKFMDEIIKFNPNIRFKPLINYSIRELIDILSKSKIYMDLALILA